MFGFEQFSKPCGCLADALGDTALSKTDTVSKFCDAARCLLTSIFKCHKGHVNIATTIW